MIFKFLLSLALLFLVYYFTPTFMGKKGNLARHILLSAHAIFLCFFTVLFSSSSFMFTHDQLEFMKNSSILDQKDKKERVNSIVTSNFIAIDIANDQTPVNYTFDGKPIAEMITDRNKLTNLLNVLSKNKKNIDLVVCDIGFTAKTTFDSLLTVRLMELYAEDKVYCGQPPNAQQELALELPNGIYADVREDAIENLQLTHSIIRDGQFSMSYRIYSQITGNKISRELPYGNFLIEDTRKQNWRLSKCSFIPSNHVSDETFLGKSANFAEEASQIPSTSKPSYWQLGDFENELNVEALLSELKIRRQNNQKNIILLGSFSGTHDTHLTAYGEKHGITNIVNTAVSLILEQHIIKVKYLILLSLCFLLILYSSLFLILREKDIRATYGLMPRFFANFLDSFFHSVAQKSANSTIFLFVKLIIDEIHLFIMLVLVSLLYLRTGEILNGLFLIIYFTLLHNTLSFFVKNTSYP